MAQQNALFAREKKFTGKKVTVTFEATGDDKIRATSLSWDSERVAKAGLADERPNLLAVLLEFYKYPAEH